MACFWRPLLASRSRAPPIDLSPLSYLCLFSQSHNHRRRRVRGRESKGKGRGGICICVDVCIDQFKKEDKRKKSNKKWFDELREIDSRLLPFFSWGGREGGGTRGFALPELRKLQSVQLHQLKY